MRTASTLLMQSIEAMRLLNHGDLFCALAMFCEEVFTYVDRIMEDRIKFVKWLDECQAQRDKAQQAIATMKAHPWFAEFCSQLVPPKSNGASWTATPSRSISCSKSGWRRLSKTS